MHTMEIVIKTLADYMYAIFNSSLDLENVSILYETAIHDREGVRIRLPCNAFFFVRTHDLLVTDKTLHGLLKSSPQTIYYCIGTKSNAYLYQPWLETFQVKVWTNQATFERNDIAAVLSHHCGFDDSESYTKEEALDNKYTLMRHFKTLVNFANQKGYAGLTRKKLDSQKDEERERISELASLITPLIDKSNANKPKLTKEGIVRLQRVIQEPLNIYRTKYPPAII